LKVEDEEGNVVLLPAGRVVAGKIGDAIKVSPLRIAKGMEADRVVLTADPALPGKVNS
jgi:hypothetical protein